MNAYDIIVVGGGHAGTEAALAAARMGASTLLVTHSIETIGQMSCNPAIGGIGKSQLVREIDALDGVMARAADRAGIQFRVLNARKGAAVRATRAQADRVLYRNAIRSLVEAQRGLALFQQAVVDLIVEGDRVRGVVTQAGIRLEASAVILTTGTFLGGRIHIGFEQHAGGRAGDAPANALADRLRAMPFRVDRLKTGTPPRIDAAGVDFSAMEEQWGDEPRPVFSALGSNAEQPRQVCCHITRTTERTHAIIAAALDQSPLYAGVIEGVGPRYCPSIEDKVVRFADRPSHQIFVEPEGLETRELYPNGISTSLPFAVQQALVASIPGFETAHITRPGYAIEYDFFDPRDLSPGLQTRYLDGLYFAGQINGTTGYEEAAAQGLLAGVNAVLALNGRPAWCPRRDEAYLGVMVDDLVAHGTTEPYRMFTSRAEYRLLLREDNADLRLTETGRSLGVVGDARWAAFQSRRDALDGLREAWKRARVGVGSSLSGHIGDLLGTTLEKDTTLFDLLRRPEVTPALALRFVAADVRPEPGLLQQLEVEAKYDGYIARQRDDIERLRRHESLVLPPDLDYGSVAGLSNELVEKLAARRPDNLGRAARIPGMTPAALSVLMVHLKKSGVPMTGTG